MFQIGHLVLVCEPYIIPTGIRPEAAGNIGINIENLRNQPSNGETVLMKKQL